jgi:pyruvate,water dikinase
MAFLIHSQHAAPTDPLGGKAAALARLSAAGFPVPRWLVVTPEAFEASVAATRRPALVVGGRSSVAEGVPEEMKLAPRIENEMKRALRCIAGEGRTWAVRSSAIDEDSASHSFAGQLESYLFVSLEDVPRRIVDVWRSAFSERVLAYRREHNLRELPQVPAVLIQQMVEADVSGVAFSADPVTGDRTTAVVGSLYGLGTALVSGEAEADTHHVDTNGKITKRQLASKTTAHRFSANGDDRIEAVGIDPDRTGKPALRDDQIVAVATLAREADQFFGCTQDIEWAIASDDLYLLQSRPITSLTNAVDRGGALAIWDNSNIVESYGGITLPLTFTFARNAYEGVYGQLCSIFRIPRKRIEENREALANMLGLIQGRVYYNLLNWHRLLATLPGYRMNRACFEQMIGVKESLPESLLGAEKDVSWHARLTDGVYLLRTVGAVVANFFLLNMKIKRFYRRVDEAIDSRSADLSSLRVDELAAEYRLLERRLMTRWDAPQINDFFAMLFHGLLKRLCIKWCDDRTESLHNGLLSGCGGMVSTEPADRVREMAAMARAHPELGDAMRHANTDHILAVMARDDDFRGCYESYLEKFGDRCSDELKLESRTLRENPLMLLRSIGFLAEHPSDGDCGDESHAVLLRREAERRARGALANNPLRRGIFDWVLRNARRFVSGRENMRLERTRVFGRVRRIFVEMGKRLHVLDLLDNPRDIFFLRMEELFGFVYGTSSTDLKKLAALRKDEFAKYSEMDPPPDRFETHGIVYQGDTSPSKNAGDYLPGDQRTGIGCCPGRVSGRVRVVLDPTTTKLARGDILVAERTDPSWVMLFPFAGGLLVERGSLLSHSAIVARELGIPTIVSIEGVTRWLRDRDWVELDGTTGVVTRVTREGERHD